MHLIFFINSIKVGLFWSQWFFFPNISFSLPQAFGSPNKGFLIVFLIIFSFSIFSFSLYFHNFFFSICLGNFSENVGWVTQTPVSADKESCHSLSRITPRRNGNPAIKRKEKRWMSKLKEISWKFLKKSKVEKIIFKEIKVKIFK